MSYINTTTDVNDCIQNQKFLCQADDICPLTVVESRKVNLHNVRIFVDVCVCVCVCQCELKFSELHLLKY